MSTVLAAPTTTYAAAPMTTSTVLAAPATTYAGAPMTTYSAPLTGSVTYAQPAPITTMGEPTVMYTSPAPGMEFGAPMTTMPTYTSPTLTAPQMTLPTTASMVAYPQLGATGPFTFYAADQMPATLPAPAGLNVPKMDTPKAPAKRDVKVAKKKGKKGKKCGCC